MALVSISGLTLGKYPFFPLPNLTQTIFFKCKICFVNQKIEIEYSLYNCTRTANMNTTNVIPIAEVVSVVAPKQESNVVSQPQNDFAAIKRMIESIDVSREVAPICCFVCGHLLLTAASVAWITVSSIALSKSSIADFREDCTGSNLWISLMVMVIAFSLGLVDRWCGKRDEDNNREPNILILAIGSASQIFSSIEVFNSCALSNLSHTVVYMLQLWMLIISFSLYGIMILAGCAMCCICCKEEAAYKTSRENSLVDVTNAFATLKETLEEDKGKIVGDNNV